MRAYRAEVDLYNYADDSKSLKVNLFIVAKDSFDVLNVAQKEISSDGFWDTTFVGIGIVKPDFVVTCVRIFERPTTSDSFVSDIRWVYDNV